MARAGKIEVRAIVEGGGDASVQDGPFRIGYGTFLRKIAPSEVDGRPVALEVLRGKGGRAAVDKHLSQRNLYRDALLILLIDREEPVAEGTAIWDFIKARHGFDRPAWADESHAHLMVQCVETWLVTDPDALAAHYGKGFKRETSPKRTNLEEEPKADVHRKLGEAHLARRSSESRAFGPRQAVEGRLAGGNQDVRTFLNDDSPARELP